MNKQMNGTLSVLSVFLIILTNDLLYFFEPNQLYTR